MPPVALPHLPVTIPHGAQISQSLFRAIEYGSLVLGAFGGALAARRDRHYKYDFTGIVGLGLISGVGGGIARDILLGDGPPLALQNPLYLTLSILGAVLALFLGRIVGTRILTLVMVVDAAGLALFAVAGSTRALAYGLGFLPALLLGVITAVGGGSLRDVFSGRPPRVFGAGELYAIVAAATSLLFLLLIRLPMPAGQASAIATTAGFAMRILAMRFGWKTSAIDHLP